MKKVNSLTKRSFLHLKDADIYYEVTGSGPAIIFAHGLGGNHVTWWQQIPFFKNNYTCIAFAHRGFSPSKETTDGPGPLAFADDLAALIHHLDLKNVRLVAQSMGGWTCLDYTLQNPTNVTALVIAASIGSITHPKIESIISQQNKSVREKLSARGIHPAAGERMAKENPSLHFLYHEIGSFSIELKKEIIRAKLHEMRKTSSDTLSSLKTPVLCIAGEEDVVMPPDVIEVFASFIPNARLERIEKTGHSVYFERPELFNQLVSDFLKDTPTPGVV